MTYWYCPRIELTFFFQYEKALEQEHINLGLVRGIETNTAHYLDVMSKAIDNVMPPATRDIK